MQSLKEDIIAVDIFSGCGGLTTGLVNAGFRVAAAVEIDSLAVEVYKQNHPDAVVWQTDIRTLRPQRLLDGLGRSQGEVDLLAGCPPCQGFSTLRTLNGSVTIDDTRNDLLLEFLRFVQAVRPRAVMMENVPRLADDDRFTVFVNTLSSLGYIGSYRVLNAADYGVPQRRHRLIYIAGYGVKIPFAEKSRKLTTIRDTLSGLPDAGNSGDFAHDMPERRSPRVMQIIRNIPKDGGSRRDLPEELKLECHRRCSGFKDVYGRMAWNDVAPTITTGCSNPSKGRFLHPEQDRAITLREAALLQGFPAEYTLSPEIGKGALAAMIGNALPPPFIMAHGKSIRRVLQKNVATRSLENFARRS